MDLLAVVMELDRKKCVILDLDGTRSGPASWPETGAPFAWTPEISGHNSYIGLYFGLHEALLALKKPRHPPGLCQQERRGPGPRALGPTPTTVRASACSPPTTSSPGG